MSSDKKKINNETDIAILKDNVAKLKEKELLIEQHEVRIALAEQNLKENSKKQELILKNTEEIKTKQQQTANVLNLVEQTNKSQWHEINEILNNLNNYKKEIEIKIGKQKKWIESKFKWQIVTFISFISVIATIISIVIALI